MTSFHTNGCERRELMCAYALRVLPASGVAAADAHIASCPDCQRELESLLLRPTPSLQVRLALRSAEETGKAPVLHRRSGHQHRGYFAMGTAPPSHRLRRAGNQARSFRDARPFL
jgi:hypothetical protein